MNKLLIMSLLIGYVLAQNETTTEVPITTTNEDITETESVTTEFLPTLSPNIATKLVPKIDKNMKNAIKNQLTNKENEVKVQVNDRFKRRKKLDKTNLAPVKNSTAAEILLNKVKSKSRVRTYHDPEFKKQKLVRIRPRVKSLTELKTESQTENSPIIETNAMLLDNTAAPQGSQHFDWSARRKVLNPRKDLFKNRFRKVNKPTAEPETEDSTEVHVVTSISDEHEIVTTTTTAPTTTVQDTTTTEPFVSTPKTSYQYVSFGTLEPTTEQLSLEKLFLDEKLDVEESEKKKRRVFNPGQTVQVDSQIQVVQALPTSYIAPKKSYQVPGLKAEQVKETVAKDAIVEDYDYTSEENVPFLDNLTEDLDKVIVNSVEKALQVSIPQDEMLRTRGVTKKPERNPSTKPQVST